MAVMTFKSEDFKDLPVFLKEYASHNAYIKGNSQKTVCEYLLDLRTFFRFMKIKWTGSELSDVEFENIKIGELTEDDLRRITTQNIIEFLMYTGVDRHNTSTTRMRKLSAIKSLFKYAHSKRHIVDVNPTSDIDAPKKKTTVPKYLTLEEAVRLLTVVLEDKDSKTRLRDYTIINLFLNTGMRLSELCGLNLESFDPELVSVKVLGKGNKERIIYLNDSTRSALEDYIRSRLDPSHVRTSSNAFFLSGREQRISPKTVQYIVYKYLRLAGLGSKGLSVHKLRHTAATLMYQSGKVDVRVLKDILGHEQLNTTQIYTHVVSRAMEDAMSSNPLSDIKFKLKNE